MHRKFLILFFMTAVLTLGVLVGFVSWMDPMRTINVPWSVDFISDRNSTLMKLTKMNENKNFTDLIVGSSTSEVFVPQTFKDNYNVEAYLAGDGGAPTAVRWIFIKEALDKNSSLKRVIYIADLFEFKNIDVESNIYFQPELAKNLKNLEGLFIAPSFLDQIYNLISRKSLQNSMKTLKDFIKYKKGEYQSQYRTDGTTEKSMVEFESDEPIDSRVLRTVRSYQSIYGNMQKLSPQTFKLYEHIVAAINQQNVELVIIISPWHELFYKNFENNQKLMQAYKDWVEYLKSLKDTNVKVIDFSYPNYKEQNILQTDEYWHDGVHFSKKTMQIMLEQIYIK